MIISRRQLPLTIAACLAAALPVARAREGEGNIMNADPCQPLRARLERLQRRRRRATSAADKAELDEDIAELRAKMAKDGC